MGRGATLVKVVDLTHMGIRRGADVLVENIIILGAVLVVETVVAGRTLAALVMGDMHSLIQI